MTRLGRIAIFILIGAATYTPVAVDADPSLRLALEPLVRYFSDQNLLPVIVPRGQKVGDVYDLQTKNFLYDQAHCFPGLMTHTIESDLPELSGVSKDTGLLAMGVRLIARGSVAGAIENEVHISFSDVEIALVSQADLRAALIGAACPEVSTMLAGGLASWFQREVVVIGELYSGIRSVDLILKDAASAAANADAIGAMAITDGVPATASVSLDGQGRAHVILKCTKRVPLAIRPAFVGRPMTGISMGENGYDRNRKPSIKWEPYDPNLPSHSALFHQYLDFELDSAGEDGTLP